MERNVIFSALNQYRFIPLDEALASKYNSRNFDKAMFVEMLNTWDSDVNYTQKVQQGDPLRIQLWASQNIFPATLTLYRCNGEQVSSTVLFNLPGGMPDLLDKGVAMFVHTIKDTSYWATADGIYYLVIEIPFDEDGDGGEDFIDLWVSEPILVKAKHPKTKLIEYSNSYNKEFIVFEQTKQKFSIRVEAAIIKPTPRVKKTVFSDQRQNSKVLSATAYRTWELNVGFTGGVPFWMIEKLNYILTLDGVYIEGKGYSAPGENAFEYEQDESAFPLYQATCEIGEKDNDDAWRFSRGGLNLIENATTFPYAIYSTEIGYTNNIEYFDGSPAIITDQTTLDAWINERNLGLANDGIESFIAMSNETVVLNRVVGELYNYAFCRVLRHRLGISNSVTGVTNITVLLKLASLSGLTYCILSKPGYSGNPTYTYIGTAVQNLTIDNYTTPGSGSFTHTLFHDSNLRQVLIEGTRVSGINQFGSPGNLPANLQYFGISNSNALVAFSFWNELKEVRATLKGIVFQNNPNYSIVTNGFWNPADGLSGWAVLENVLMRFNGLSTATVNAIFNSYLTANIQSQWFVYNGVILIDGQTPPGPPTVSSAFARMQLGPVSTGGTYNWTILTD